PHRHPRSAPDRIYSADPNAPIVSYGFRRGVRARLAVTVPLLSEESPAPFLTLTPLFEVHNEAGADPSYVPHELWRGRVELRGGYAVQLSRDPAGVSWLRLGAGLEHESDHATDRSRGGFVSFHNALLFGELVFPLGPLQIASLLGGRVLFLSCTRASICTGDSGETGLE